MSSRTDLDAYPTHIVVMNRGIYECTRILRTPIKASGVVRPQTAGVFSDRQLAEIARLTNALKPRP